MNGKAQKLLKDFVTKTLDIRGAILINPEGIISEIYTFSNREDDEEKAIMLNLLPLTEPFQKNLNIGKLERIIVESQEGYCVITSCQDNSILLVLADKKIVKGWLFMQIKRLIKEISP